MSRTPSTFIRFYYDGPVEGAVDSPLGRYKEIDMLISDTDARVTMGRYQSVVFMVKMSVRLEWLRKQEYADFVEYDGTTLYVRAGRYVEGYNVLQHIVEHVSRGPGPTFPEQPTPP